MSPLPRNLSGWKQQAKKNHVTMNTSIHDLLDVASASSIGLRQYYSLRVLWKANRELPDATFLGISREDDAYVKAREHLNLENKPWQMYLNDIRSTFGDPVKTIRDIGAFSFVRYYQLSVIPLVNAYKGSSEEVMKLVKPKFSPRRSPNAEAAPKAPYETPSNKRGSPLDFDSSFDDSSIMTADSFSAPPPQTPATKETTPRAEDEQIVNMALLLLLQAFIIFHPLIQREGLEWSGKRLKLDFGRWEGRTDGYLRRNEEIQAIMEVKPFVRADFLPAIQKQESAQMAAWIRNFPNNNGWVVEKDGRELER